MLKCPRWKQLGGFRWMTETVRGSRQCRALSFPVFHSGALRYKTCFVFVWSRVSCPLPRLTFDCVGAFGPPQGASLRRGPQAQNWSPAPKICPFFFGQSITNTHFSQKKWNHSAFVPAKYHLSDSCCLFLFVTSRRFLTV